MARYEHLPIYKQALDVAVHFERVVAGFSRYHKYSLGAELRSQSRAVVVAIVKANAARDKQALLLALREKPDELLITVQKIGVRSPVLHSARHYFKQPTRVRP